MHELAVLHSLPFLFEARTFQVFQFSGSTVLLHHCFNFKLYQLSVNLSLQALYLMLDRLLCDTSRVYS